MAKRKKSELLKTEPFSYVHLDCTRLYAPSVREYVAGNLSSIRAVLEARIAKYLGPNYRLRSFRVVEDPRDNYGNIVAEICFSCGIRYQSVNEQYEHKEAQMLFERSLSDLIRLADEPDQVIVMVSTASTFHLGAADFNQIGNARLQMKFRVNKTE